MIRTLPACLLSLGAIASAGPAFGQTQSGGPSLMRGHDSNAPIDITADRFEAQDKADRATWVGRVHAVQGDMTMDSARMTVAYTRAKASGANPQIHRVDASGGVTVVQPDQRASGSFGIYDVDRKIITLIGGVRLVRNGNTLNGARAVMNLETGRSTVDGSAVGGGGGTTTSAGGRVTGRFTVPQRAQATPAGTAGK